MVGSVFVEERCFQFRLPDRVRRECKAWRCFALRVEFDQVTGNVFELAFDARFFPFPFACAEFAQCWRGAIGSRVAFEFVDVVQVEIDDVALGKEQSDALLLMAADFDGLKPIELADAFINVDKVIAAAQLLQLAKRELGSLLIGGTCASAFENLVFGDDGDPLARKQKPCVWRACAPNDAFQSELLVRWAAVRPGYAGALGGALNGLHYQRTGEQANLLAPARAKDRRGAQPRSGMPAGALTAR